MKLKLMIAENEPFTSTNDAIVKETDLHYQK